MNVISFILTIAIISCVSCKEPLNITCTLDPMQITVEIFTSRPLFNVQLKNSDRSCDPQDFTADSIKFVIPNYQIGMCGFVRSGTSADGLDGTFWNNLIWKEKPTSKSAKTTKIKCTQKLSSIISSLTGSAPVMQMPMRIQVIHLPFGAFPSTFNTDGIPPMASGDPLLGGSQLSQMPSGLMSPFPPGIQGGPGMGSGIIMLRSGQLPFGRSDMPVDKMEGSEGSGLKPGDSLTSRPSPRLPITIIRK